MTRHTTSTCASACPTANVEELLASGVDVDHDPLPVGAALRAPLLAEAAQPCRHAVGDRWWADETSVKVCRRQDRLIVYQRKSLCVKGLVGRLVRRLSLHSGDWAWPNSV